MYPASQKRHPSVQPRAISMEARSKTARDHGSGAPTGTGTRSRSSITWRRVAGGPPERSGTRNPVRPSRTSPRSDGTRTPGRAASARNTRSRGAPSRRRPPTSRRRPGRPSSASPTKKASKNGATGAGRVAHGPPPSTMGSSAPRSRDRRGMPERSRMFRTFVYESSCWSENPTTSKCRSGVNVSSVTRGNPDARNSASRSGQGAKQRSRHRSGSRAITSYRMWDPRCDIPTS